MNALPAILWIAAALCAVMVCAVTVHCSHFGRADVVVKPVSWAVIIGQLTTFVLFAMPYFLFLANKDSIGTQPAHVEPLPDDGDADGDETHEGMSII